MMKHSNNYEISLQNAQKRFCSYPIKQLSQKHGVTDQDEYLHTGFLGMTAKICKKSGQLTLDGTAADFCEALSVFDWLCDSKTDARASGVFAPVGSLPGVLVSGQGLLMKAPRLAKAIENNPVKFREICKKMGGISRDMGDIGYEIPIFPGLTMVLKFYFGDTEFPPDITFLWDRNILQFVRYETVYYIAATVKKHLQAHLDGGCTQ